MIQTIESASGHSIYFKRGKISLSLSLICAKIRGRIKFSHVMHVDFSFYVKDNLDSYLNTCKS